MPVIVITMSDIIGIAIIAFFALAFIVWYIRDAIHRMFGDEKNKASSQRGIDG